MNTRQVDEYIKRLKRRRDFLEQNTEDKDHFAKAELAALTWGIEYIEDTALIAAEHQTKYIERLKQNGETSKVHDDRDHTNDPVWQSTAKH